MLFIKSHFRGNKVLVQVSTMPEKPNLVSYGLKKLKNTYWYLDTAVIYLLSFHSSGKTFLFENIVNNTGVLL